MKLIWHIVKKDLQSHWLPYAIWFGLLVCKVIICVLIQTPDATNAEWFERMSLGYYLAAAIETTLGFLLAAAFVLEDGLVGSRMFWTTRPISGRRLLAAKALGIGLLLCVVPIVVWLPWWAVGGFGLEDYAQSGFYVVSVQLLTVVPAVIIASLSGRSSRFLLSLLVIVVLFAFSSVVQGTGSAPGPLTALAVSEARFWLGSVFAGLTILAVLWFQFTARQTKTTLVILATGSCLVLWVANFWPWSLGLKPETWGRDATGVENVSVEVARVSFLTERVAKDHRMMEVQVRVRNLPGDLTVRSGRAAFKYVWKDGFSYVHEVHFSSGNARVESPPQQTLGIAQSILTTDPETKAYLERQYESDRRDFAMMSWLRSHHVRDINKTGQQLLSGRAVLPLEVVERIHAQEPLSSMRVTLSLVSPKIRLDVPLPQENTTMVGEGLRVAAYPSYYLNPPPNEQRLSGFSLLSSRPMLGESILFCVVHPETGFFSWVSRSFGARIFIPSQVSFQRSSVRAFKPLVRRGDLWVPAPGADNGYRFIAFTREPAGVLRKDWAVQPIIWSIPGWLIKTPAR